MKLKPTTRRHLSAARAALTLSLTGIILSASANAANLWDGGGTGAEWTDDLNWDDDLAPVFGTLTFAGALQTTNTVAANVSMNMLVWTGTEPWTVNNASGAGISLVDLAATDAARLENQSTGLVSINAPLEFAASAGPNWGGISALNGDIAFGSGALTVNGSALAGLKVKGAGHAVTMNNSLNASGKWLATTDAVTLAIGAAGTVTAGNMHVMNGGTLSLAGSISHSPGTGIVLGGDSGATGMADLTKAGTFLLSPLTGGLTNSSPISTVAANTSAALLVSSQNTSGTNTLGGAISLNSPLGITQAGGGMLALGGGIDLKSQTLTLTAGTGANINASAAIASSTSSGTLVKVGAGTATLGAANTYRGNTTISGGTLVLTGSGGIYTGNTKANANSLVINGNGILSADRWGWGSNQSLGMLNFNNGYIAVDGGTLRNVAATSTYMGGAGNSRGINVGANGLIIENATAATTWTWDSGGGNNSYAASAQLTLTGAGNGVFKQSIAGTGVKLVKSGNGIWTLGAVNSYTGNTTVSTGTLVVGAGARIYHNAYNGSAVVSVASGATLDLQNWGYGETTLSLGGLSANANAMVVNGGTIRISGTTPTSYGRGVTVQAGGATLEAGSGANWTIDTVNDNVAWVYTSNPSLTFTGAGTGNFQKVFSGGGALIKSGTGSWTFSGDNTYTGATTVNGGTMVLSKSAGAQLYKTGAFFGANDTTYITVNTGGIFESYNWEYGSTGALSELRNNYYSLAINGGTIRLTDSFSALRGFSVGASGGTLEVTAGNTYTKGAGTTVSQNIIRFSADSTLTVTGAGNTVINDSLAPGGYGNTGFAISKSGTGTLTLTGANAYTGGTTVNDGILLVNNTTGSGTGAGAVTVAFAATLGGTGAITGSVALAGTVAPGATVGTLITGNLTFAEDSAYAWDIADWTGISGSGWDLLTAGSLTFSNTLTGKLTIRITGTPANFSEVAKTFVIAQGSGTSGFDAANIAIDASGFSGSGTWVVQQNPGNANIIELVYTGAAGYADWASSNAPSGDASDDFDGDGVPNGVEYVLGGNKDSNDLAKLPVIGKDGANMTFSFVRDQTSIGADTAVAVEVGTTLSTWPDVYPVPDAAVANNPGITVVDNLDGTDTVTLTLPMSPETLKFARLRVVISAPAP